MSSNDEIELSQTMNHCVVPEFEMDIDNDYPSISSPIFTPSKKSRVGDEEIMELVWQNGRLTVQSQSQNQRCMKKSDLFAQQSAVEESVEASAPLFMQEYETMTSLLQSPVDDSSSFTDFLYTTPATSAALAREIDTTTSCTAVSTAAVAEKIDTTTCCTAAVSSAKLAGEVDRIDKIDTSSRLIMPQLKCSEGEFTHRLENYLYTRPNCAGVNSVEAVAEEIDTSNASSSRWPPIISQLRSTEGESIGHFSLLPKEAILRNCFVKPSTIVESTDTVIAALPEYTVSPASDDVTTVSAAAGGGGREVMTPCELTLTSSTSGSAGSVSASVEPLHPSLRADDKAVLAAASDRKRKNGESDDDEGQSEDVELESADAKKQVRSSTSAKKSRAAKVHNLSERKRRDRINEKMKALQELIPRCNKIDKASMLDEAIEYLKSLQLQVQMMSTGCNMVHMMYPGIPQYMPAMGMNMGMVMNMEMGMNRPMVPYPPLLPGPAVQNPAVAAQMAPQYPLPACHLPSRIPAANQPDPPSRVGHNINQPGFPNFSDPYHQYFGLQQAQQVLPQSQRVEQPSSSKSNSCVEESAGNHQSG